MGRISSPCTPRFSLDRQRRSVDAGMVARARNCEGPAVVVCIDFARQADARWAERKAQSQRLGRGEKNREKRVKPATALDTCTAPPQAPAKAVTERTAVKRTPHVNTARQP